MSGHKDGRGLAVADPNAHTEVEAELLAAQLHFRVPDA